MSYNAFEEAVNNAFEESFDSNGTFLMGPEENSLALLKLQELTRLVSEGNRDVIAMCGFAKRMYQMCETDREFTNVWLSMCEAIWLSTMGTFAKAPVEIP